MEYALAADNRVESDSIEQTRNDVSLADGKAVVQKALEDLQKLYDDTKFMEEYPHDFYGRAYSDAWDIVEYMHKIGYRGFENAEIDRCYSDLSLAFRNAEVFAHAELEKTWGPGDREGAMAGMSRSRNSISTLINYAKRVIRD
jgi:hypothetical protein